MARAGILYSHVAQAASKLLEGGKNPTVDNVREALGGTGSKSTIAPLLKRWKAEHQGELAQAEAGLPQSLLAAVKEVYQHMQAEFAQQIDQTKQEHAEAWRVAADREQQARTERDAALAAKEVLTGELAHTRDALAQLQASHHAQSVTLATVEAENTGLQQRLADRAAEVATLDHQLTQTRAQFEHYQEATAAQRAEERQSYEQRIVRIEQDLAGANRQIAAQQSTLGQQETRMAQLTSDQASVQQALRVAQEELAPLRLERERLSAQLEETVAARQTLADQIGAMQQQLTDTRTALAAQEREACLRAEQARRAEERADRLSEEKIDLLQVRATLEQQVRHATSSGDAR